MARVGSGFARDIFFHQRSAVVVGAGLQAELRKFAVQLHPRDLDVRNRAGEKDSGQRMNLEMFGQRWSGAGETLLEQKRVLVHKAQRNELGEAAGFTLNLR